MNTKLITAFLRDLSKNNHREWFNSNKNRYLQAKEDFENFISKLIPEVAKIDPEISKLSVKDCVFRIYNDTRFYKDKPPYKTNMGAFMTPGGKNAGQAGYYFHIEPDNCFLGGGVYMPPSERLKLIRQEIYFKMTEFLKIIEDKNFKKYFGTIDGDQLSRIPKGFPKEFNGSEWVKYKSFAVLHPLKQTILETDKAISHIIGVYTYMRPLNHFLNNALAT